MPNPSFSLRTEQDRQRAIQILARIDLDSGKTWSIKEECRSDAQNRRMWAMLRDISSQVEWHGRKLDSESWKHVFSAAVQQQDVVPGINGGFVVLGISTRRQTKGWFADMFTIMEAFGAERGVHFHTLDVWGVAA